MQIGFLTEASNIIILGSHGVGKSTVAQNLGYKAVMLGHTVLFTTAANSNATPRSFFLGDDHNA